MRPKFRQSLMVCGLALFAFLFFINEASAQTPMVKSGDLFPEIPLMLPQGSEFGDYLGIDPEKPFTIGGLKAELILVEIMNINCGNCQKQAPVYNKLFSRIDASPDLKNKIKILAIGAGNKNEFIKKYQDHFKSPYPIVEDPPLEVYNALGKSPVPLAIYVRPDPVTGRALVLNTHTGYQNDPEAIFSKMISLLEADVQALKGMDTEKAPEYSKVKPVLTVEALTAKVKTAFQNQNKTIQTVERITLKDGSDVFIGAPEENASDRIFARLVSQPSPCDLCHDVHFIYVFDRNGKILQFVPVQLTKYGNKAWSDQDILQMKQTLEGRFIYRPFNYDAKVDAVTSATITSLVVIESLNEGKTLFEELQTRRLVD